MHKITQRPIAQSTACAAVKCGVRATQIRQIAKYPVVALLLLLLSVLAGCSNTRTTTTYTGIVTKVHDGDSIHITPKGKKRVIIRLAGIDAPELKQPFGIASRDTLRSIILQQPAKAECNKKDRYNRNVCVVYYKGEDINLQRVRAGMAWHYKAYQQEQTRRQRRQYSSAETRARRGRIGLWSADSIEPWVFRKLESS